MVTPFYDLWIETVRIFLSYCFGDCWPAGPPSIIHFALEIEKQNYDNAKSVLNEKNIKIEKELTWEKGTNSIYFIDPAGNLVEIITPGSWPIDSV
jgi:hypothetical protein